MKTLLFIAAAMAFTAPALARGPSFSACRSDGCDIRRVDQVQEVMKFLTDGDDSCNSLNSSLLKFERLSEDTFAITCGEGPRNAKRLVLRVRDEGPVEIVKDKI